MYVLDRFLNEHQCVSVSSGSLSLQEHIPETDTSISGDEPEDGDGAFDAEQPREARVGRVGTGGGRTAGDSLFPGRHSKDKRDAIMKVLPFVKDELRQQSDDRNPARLDKYARRVYIRNGIEKAVQANAANKLWGEGAVYKAKSSAEDAISNLYWDYICRDL